MSEPNYLLLTDVYFTQLSEVSTNVCRWLCCNKEYWILIKINLHINSNLCFWICLEENQIKVLLCNC